MSRRPPFAVVLVMLVAGAACRGTPEVGFRITIPRDLADSAAWFEVGAFRDARCSAVKPLLMDGIPEGSTTRLAFRRDAGKSPRVGDLAAGSYAFAAVAKGDDCAVLATGCVVADVSDVASVAIAMEATETPSGACGAGASCQAARCVPALDNADPSVGAGCSLELIGSGPLANATAGGGTLVSAPVIAATPTGFVIVYREVDPSSDNARVTVLPIDSGGGALTPARPLLKGRCASIEETDGVGLVMNQGEGQLVLARPACGGRPGLELLSFSSKPDITIDPNFRSSDSPTARLLSLSSGHVAAQGTGPGVVVFTEDGASRIATILPGNGVAAPSGSFGGTTGMTGAWVAASDKILALLSAGVLGSTPTGDAGPGAPAGGGGGPSGPALSLVMAPSSTSADKFSALEQRPRPPIVFPGLWGAVAALGTRAIVVSDGADTGRSISYRAFDLDRTAATVTDGLSVESEGVIRTADITMLDDRAFIAMLKAGSVSLHVLSRATTTPEVLREVIFERQRRIPAVLTVRDDGRVAVAATSSRVAVAWTTTTVLGNDDPTGGYAVFACTP